MDNSKHCNLDNEYYVFLKNYYTRLDEYYEKLLEDVEDNLAGTRDDVEMVLFRVRDMLKSIVAKRKSCTFKKGDIISDGANTLILLYRSPEWRVVITYSALRNDVLLMSEDDIVHFHKVGHMEPIKITIHNEEEN